MNVYKLFGMHAFRIETEVKGEQADHVVLQHNDVYTYCSQHQQNVSCVISSSENHRQQQYAQTL